MSERAAGSGCGRAMRRLLACLLIPGTLLALLARSPRAPAPGGPIFSEDFEPLADGPLAGQGGWSGDPMNLRSEGTRLGSRVLDGFDVNGIRDSPGVRRPIDLGAVSGPLIVMSFDAFASSGAVGIRSHNAQVGLAGTSRDPRLVWANDTNVAPAWYFDARYLTGNPTHGVSIPGGHDRTVTLTLVIDRVRRETYGRYDFGGGVAGETPHYPVTPAAIEALSHVVIIQDGRSRTAYVGFEFDHICIFGATATGPEPLSVHGGPRLGRAGRVPASPFAPARRPGSGRIAAPGRKDPGRPEWTETPRAARMAHDEAIGRPDPDGRPDGRRSG